MVEFRIPTEYQLDQIILLRGRQALRIVSGFLATKSSDQDHPTRTTAYRRAPARRVAAG
jgi:hypothetical protein